MFFEAIQGTRSRKKISEWCLLAGAAMVVALFLLLSYYAAMRQVEADERERLQTLTNVIATDIAVNLIATDNAINGIILDHFLGEEKYGSNCVASAKGARSRNSMGTFSGSTGP